GTQRACERRGASEPTTRRIGSGTGAGAPARDAHEYATTVPPDAVGARCPSVPVPAPAGKYRTTSTPVDAPSCTSRETPRSPAKLQSIVTGPSVAVATS